MKVELISYTQDAEDLLLFTKSTRLGFSPGLMEEIKGKSKEDKEADLRYVLGTIASSWEFVGYVFLITDVTRAFTHQLVRHRVGTSFAQQAQRVADMSGFSFMTPDEFARRPLLKRTYDDTMEDIATGYGDLIDQGARPQDARGVLPTNIHTNIVFGANLRTLSEMFLTRMCVRAQGEFQKVAFALKDEVLNVHPWAESVLNCFCVRYGRCRWPNYTQCPVKDEFSWLDIPREGDKACVKDSLDKLTGYDPQPTEGSWDHNKQK